MDDDDYAWNPVDAVRSRPQSFSTEKPKGSSIGQDDKTDVIWQHQEGILQGPCESQVTDLVNFSTSHTSGSLGGSGVHVNRLALQHEITGHLEDYLSRSLAPRDISKRRAPLEDIAPPLTIDSTRIVWNKLTSIHVKVVKYRGSAVEGEVRGVLTHWQTMLKNQPSWNRPMAQAMKKNRESIGPRLFGWNRTDIEPWQPPPPPASESMEPDAPLSRTITDTDEFGDFEGAGIVDVEHAAQGENLEHIQSFDAGTHADDFGDFEDAVSGGVTGSESVVYPFEASAHVPGVLSKARDSVLAVSESPSSLRILSPVPRAFNDKHGMFGEMNDNLLDMEPFKATENWKPSGTLSQNNLLDAQEAAEGQDALAAAEADNTWDLSLFEKQFQVQTPPSNPSQSLEPEKEEEALAQMPQPMTKERRNRELANQIVSMIPDIEYILS